MSRQNLARMEAKKRRSTVGHERRNGDKHSKDPEGLSALGIGRRVSASTVEAVGTSWQTVAGHRAESIHLDHEPQLLIVAGEELSQVRGWRDCDDSDRASHIGTLLTKLAARGVISRNATRSLLEVTIEDPRELFSIDADGRLVATLSDLPEHNGLAGEVMAVRNALGLDTAPPDQSDTGLQIVFGVSAEEANDNNASRIDVKRIGLLLPAYVSFEPIGVASFSNL